MVGSAPATRATIRDRQLRRRALAVVPGGMYGHQHVSWLAAGSPQFFERAEGCRIWDVDGNEYVDDVRAGFRIDLGGSWEPIGVRPDLAAFGKAIANGYPLAAVTGTDRLRADAASVFVTGSFWTEAVPMAAALATIRKLRDTHAVDHMRVMGERLRQGLERQAAAHGLRIRQTGPPQMPIVLFEDDADTALGAPFVEQALERGVYLHHLHTLFVSASHTELDVDRTLDATDAAFAEVARRAPS